MWRKPIPHFCFMNTCVYYHWYITLIYIYIKTHQRQSWLMCKNCATCFWIHSVTIVQLQLLVLIGKRTHRNHVHISPRFCFGSSTPSRCFGHLAGRDVPGCGWVTSDRWRFEPGITRSTLRIVSQGPLLVRCDPDDFMWLDRHWWLFIKFDRYDWQI